MKTETLVDIRVHYYKDNGKEGQKSFRLESAAARFLADTPSAFRVDRTTTVIEWLEGKVLSAPDTAQPRHDSFLPA